MVPRQLFDTVTHVTKKRHQHLEVYINVNFLLL